MYKCNNPICMWWGKKPTYIDNRPVCPMCLTPVLVANHPGYDEYDEYREKMRRE